MSVTAYRENRNMQVITLISKATITTTMKAIKTIALSLHTLAVVEEIRKGKKMNIH